MYIMADLSNFKNNTKPGDLNRQRLLCAIKIDANGSLIMKPDFNCSIRSPYLIYTHGTSREGYEYILEHVSSQISAENLVRELRLHKELYVRHSNYIRNLVGNAFKMVSCSV